MVGKLTKMSSVHNNVQKDFEGYAPFEPVVGKTFFVANTTPLNQEVEHRFLTTSVVNTVHVEHSEKMTVYTFSTKNSWYKFEVTKENK